MKNIMIFLLWLFSMTISAQDFNPKKLSLPENVSAKDLAFLKDELKNVQVVLLGEKTHDDGNVFEMKTKIIEFLYQEMGFKTIAFESGVYDVWKAQKSINKSENVNESLKKSLFTIWSKKNEFQSFVNFYDKNKRDLKLFGFDNQLTGKFGQEELVQDLYDYCKYINFNFKLNKEDFDLLIESMLNSYMFDEEDITFEQYKNTLSQLLLKIEKQPKSEEGFYWKQIIKSLLVLGEQCSDGNSILSSFNTSASDNIRDKQMADNMLAYLKENPNEKVICWGANTHFANNMSSVSAPIIKEFVPMGTYLKSTLKDKVYSLAAVTAADSIYLQNKWNETPISSNSFEAYLKKSNEPYLFISSDQEEMKKPQINRLFSPITFIEARLDLLHDGYLYFDRVVLSTPVDIVNEDGLKEKVALKLNNDINSSYEVQNEDQETKLNEVVVYGKKTPYQIIKNVIEASSSNYPNSNFNSIMYSNVNTIMDGVTCLDFDFVTNQFDLGYVNHINRSTKKIVEIKWNIKEDYGYSSIRDFHGLVYNIPINRAAFLKLRKFKKFHFTLEDVIKYDNEEVYVISFNSPRNHFSYTSRSFLSNYSGYMYINKSDLAIVKLFENWEVTDYPEHFKVGYRFKNTLSKFILKEYFNESSTINFKKINNLYFITQMTYVISGKISDDENNFKPYTTTINSYWTDFNITNPLKIRNKDEQHLFKEVKYNESFWETFKMDFLKK